VRYQRHLQKAHPWAKRRRIRRIDRQNRPTDATCGFVQKTKKKGRLRQWQTSYSPRPPTSSKRNVVWHGGWSSGGSYKFQVSSKSVHWFSGCGGRNLPIPIALSSGLYNSLYKQLVYRGLSRNKSIFSKKDIYAYLASRAAENRHGRLCSAVDSHFNDSCLSDQLSQHLLDRSSPNFQGWYNYDCR